MIEIPADFPTYPPLSRSWKGAYPFRLGTTSFIYPDHYIPNVRMLGPFVDEIELLMFESRWPESLPSEEIIDALFTLSMEMNVGYNIHLPTDVSLASPDRPERDRAAAVLGDFVRATTSLSPSAWALHLPFEGDLSDTKGVDRWQAAAAEGLDALLSAGVSSRRLAVETLDYPFDWAIPLVEAFDLSICMDIGHLILYERDPGSFYHRHHERIPLIHLHGVRPPKGQSIACSRRDHVGLDELPPEHFPSILQILTAFRGVVSLEVFAHRHLVSSLKVLERYRQDCRKGKKR